MRSQTFRSRTFRSQTCSQTFCSQTFCSQTFRSQTCSQTFCSHKPENNILLYCDRSILEFTLNPKSVIGKIKVSARIKTIVNKQAKKIVEYDDRYDCASDVPDSEWQNGNPNEQREHSHNDLRFYEIDGKWCHYDKKVRYFGDNNMPGGGGHAKFYNVLQYESPSSDRYYIRKAIFIDNPSYGEKDTHTFVTTTKSMYQN